MNTDQRPKGWKNPSDKHMKSGVDLGSGHWMHREFWLPKSDRIIGYPARARIPRDAVFIGVHDHHRSKNPGSEHLWCGGYVWFANVPVAKALEAEGRGVANHTLVTVEPLTITASLGCRGCPDHGFIRDGRWVPA